LKRATPLRALALLGICAGALACGEFPALPPCTSNADCDPGQACVDTQCVAGEATDAAARPPNDARSMGDGRVAPPDAAVVVPDAAVVVPDAAVVLPDAAVVLPDAAVAIPDAAVVVTPDAAVIVPPDAAVVLPDAAAVLPDAAVVLPDAAVVLPDAAVVLPDAAVVLPDAMPPDACAPSPETCNGLDDDCDGAADNFDHLGLPCVPVDPSTCGPSVWTCAGETEPVCPPAHDVNSPEVCNGEDDDCDGEIDEGFDLQTDTNHCGVCGHTCDPTVHGRGVCIEGTCVAARCDAGFFDASPEAGCDTEVAGDVLYVRRNGNDAAAGTIGAPLATLAEANRRAASILPPGHVAVIDLGAGHFSGNLDLEAGFLTVRGAGRDLTQIDGRVTISGRFTRVQDLTVDAGGGPVGIHLTCPEACAVVSTLVLNVGPEADPDEPGGPLAGVRITGGTGHLLYDNEITGVTGNTPPVPPFEQQRGCQWAHGSPAAGVLLEGGASGSRLVDNRIDAITGGAGTVPSRESCNGGSLGGLGGAAYGIHLANEGGQYLLSGNRITDITGGDGGAGQGGIASDPNPPDASDNERMRSADGNGGGGGLAAGIRIEGGGHRMRNNAIAGVRGGRGGAAGTGGTPGNTTGEPGPDAEGFGLYFHPFVADAATPPADLFADLRPDEPALGNDIDTTNTYEREPILYCFGRSVEWSGYRLDTPRNPTNLGRMVLVDCDGSTVHDNVLGGFVGATGRAGDDDAVSTPGAEGAGILLLGTSAARVFANQVAGVRGGTGAQGAFDASGIALLTAGGRGGHAAAIRLRDADANFITDNDLLDVTGGAGGPGGLAHGNGGPGGRAAGIELVGGSTGNVLQRNTIRTLAGGTGGPTEPFTEPRDLASSGRAFGVEFADADSLDNLVDETNTYEGFPLTYVFGQPNAVIAGRHYPTCKAMTNLGQIVVIASPQARLSDVEVLCAPAPGDPPSDLVGEPGLPATSLNFGEMGGAYVAVRVQQSADVSIDGLRVAGVQGGPGGQPHLILRGGNGGVGCALSVKDSPGFRLHDAHVWDVRSGHVAAAQPGLPGLDHERPGGLGADAIALDIGNSPGFELSNVLVHDVHSEGHALGLFLTDVGLGNVVRQATFAVIDGQNLGRGNNDPQAPNITSAVLIWGPNGEGAVLLDNLVVADVTNVPVWVFDRQRADRTATCFRGVRQIFQLGPGIPTGPFWENPEPFFGDDPDAPWGLDPASMCVDLGTGPCFDEPARDGETCLTDLGYEGNSPLGQVRGGP
jgi:hypothetical protein